MRAIKLEDSPAPHDAQSELAKARAQLAARDHEVERLLEANRELLRDSREKGTKLDQLLSSTSWKITRPLRIAAEWKRVVFPLLRWKRFTFSYRTGRHLTRLPSGEFRVEGPSSELLLDSDQGRFPTGWVSVRGRIASKSQHIFFLLYYRADDTFDGSNRVWITLGTQGITPQVVRLPRNVAGLRLDPFTQEGEFALEEFSIQELGKLQVLYRAVRSHVSTFRSNPRLLVHKMKRAYTAFKLGGIGALRTRLFSAKVAGDYPAWVESFDTITEEDRIAIRTAVNSFAVKPLISVIMPTYNTPEKYLRLAIESVLMQLYQNWELVIADDASSAPHVRPVLEEYAKKDPRVKVIFRPVNGHISAATNSALEAATGEYVAFLDHDDELTEHALATVAETIVRSPNLNLIYSDEDKKTAEGKRFNPYFKSGWNPDLFLQQNYICHLAVYRRSVVSELGGLRSRVEGAQDWDLALRVIEKSTPEQIRHIPHVLYHWRVIEGSTAEATSHKPYVMEAQRTAVSEHLTRRGIDAQVEILHDISQLRVRRPLPVQHPLVSIIIPTKDRVTFLERCVESIRDRSAYRNFEIIIVDNGSYEDSTKRYFAKLENRSGEGPPVRILRDEKPFNFSRLNNRAVREAARGELIGFLNNDLETISDEWLGEMVSHAVRPEVGAVGARLLYPNGHLQHGGIILGIGGIAGHNHKSRPRHDPGYFNRAILTSNFSAVTAACLLMRREVFDEVGGFDEENLTIAFNDVDLCMRIRQKGHLIVYTPYAELFHYESASRGYEDTPEKFRRFEKEIAAMYKRWGSTLEEDPYYNPNLTLLHEDFSFAFPPRAKKFWKSET